MDDVHVASDSRLERKVAIKLVPEELRAEPERRARFLREARRATEMLPVEHDTIVGGAPWLDRFHTELRVGAFDKAVHTLEECLSRPTAAPRTTT